MFIEVFVRQKWVCHAVLFAILTDVHKMFHTEINHNSIFRGVKYFDIFDSSKNGIIRRLVYIYSFYNKEFDVVPLRLRVPHN